MSATIDLPTFAIGDLERRLCGHLEPTRRRSATSCWFMEDLWRDKDGYPILCVN